MIFGLESHDRDYLGIRESLPEFTRNHTITGKVGKEGRVAIQLPATYHCVDIALIPFLDLAEVGGILAAAILEVVYHSLQFHGGRANEGSRL